MAEIFIYNSANVVSCIICILPVSQDYCFLYNQKYAAATAAKLLQ